MKIIRLYLICFWKIIPCHACVKNAWEQSTEIWKVINNAMEGFGFSAPISLLFFFSFFFLVLFFCSFVFLWFFSPLIGEVVISPSDWINKKKLVEKIPLRVQLGIIRERIMSGGPSKLLSVVSNWSHPKIFSTIRFLKKNSSL